MIELIYVNKDQTILPPLGGHVKGGSAGPCNSDSASPKAMKATHSR